MRFFCKNEEDRSAVLHFPVHEDLSGVSDEVDCEKKAITQRSPLFT
jgi:hypothetical protein